MNGLGELNPILLAIEAQNTLNEAAFLHSSNLALNGFVMHNANGIVRQITPLIKLNLTPLHNTPHDGITLKAAVQDNPLRGD